MPADISKHHVSTRYLTERLSDVSDDFTLEKLIFLTKMAWEALQKGHGGITHDGYTKQCQLHNKFGFGGHPPVVCPGCGPNEPRARLLESRWGPYCALCEHNVLVRPPGTRLARMGSEMGGNNGQGSFQRRLPHLSGCWMERRC